MTCIDLINESLVTFLQLSDGDKTEIIKDLERQYQAKLDAIEAKVSDLVILQKNCVCHVPCQKCVTTQKLL